MVWKAIRGWFFPEPIKRKIRAELDGKVLHMYYPLSNGEIVHKSSTFPDEAMALDGYQRFLRDVVDQLPGHAERKHLRSVQLNNELIAASSLNWVPSDENGSGPRSLS